MSWIPRRWTCAEKEDAQALEGALTELDLADIEKGE
jgi:hypothetical protein